MRDLLLGLLSLLIALVVLALVGELTMRLYLFAKELTTGHTVILYDMDEELGWRAASNYRFSGELLDAAGESYTADVSTDESGFRAYGDVATTGRKKILFLGDSFTHAEQISDDKTYFSLAGEALSMEVFAVGVGGYGTLQQYMMLDRHIDEIAPDIVVLQLCSNDFINNSYELEYHSAHNNNHKRRPYYTGAGVEYRLPKPNPRLWHFANAYSRLLYFIVTRLDRLRPVAEDSSEARMSEQGWSYPPYAASIDVTGQLLAKIRERVPDSVPVYAFNTDSSELFRRLSEENGLTPVWEVPAALEAARKRGMNLEAADRAHWNNAGHRVVAEALALSIGGDSAGQ